MTLRIPSLHLSHGQLVWTLCLGDVPPRPRRQHLLAQLRYLRQLGIPFSETTRGRGPGRPIQYAYEEAVEVALGLHALRRQVQPHLVQACLLTNRRALRPLYRKALAAQPTRALEAEWVGSRGTILPLFAHEYWLRLHNRYSDTPGRYDITSEAAGTATELFGLKEHHADGTTVVALPLTRVVLELVYWASRVPVIRAGRRPRPSQPAAPPVEDP